MEIRVLSSVEIMRAIVDQIGCKLNVFNEDEVYRKDNHSMVREVERRVGSSIPRRKVKGIDGIPLPVDRTTSNRRRHRRAV